MAVKEKSNECEEMEWSAEEEIQLFLALCGLRPIGINKHIHMACICKRLSNALKRDIQPEIVWAHLNTMYNLDALNQMEPLPIPQELSEFSMPELEYSSLITKKLQEEERKLEEKNESGQKSKSTTPQPQGITSKSTPIAIQKPTNQQNNVKPSTSTMGSSKISTPTTASGGSSSSVGNSGSVGNGSGGSVGSGSGTSAKFLSSTTTATLSKPLTTSKVISNLKSNEIDRKTILLSNDSNNTPKRAPKRTRGSMSIESNSPSTTPPPTHTKRRRI